MRQVGSDLEGHPTPRLPFVDVATGKETKRLAASRNPWSAALSPDGRRLLVTNALSRFGKFRTAPMSEVTVFDVAGRRVASQAELDLLAPPLRESYLTRWAATLGKALKTFSPEAQEALLVASVVDEREGHLARIEAEFLAGDRVSARATFEAARPHCAIAVRNRHAI